MKINKAKLLVGTLAVIATAATVGSISGTVAWFQYSTRSTAAYQGATAHCSENLQIRIRSGSETDYPWKKDLLASDIKGYIDAAGGVSGAARANSIALHPVTSQALDLDASSTDTTVQHVVPTTLYKNPIYQYKDKTVWGTATLEDYIVIPLELRVLDVDGAASATYLKKKIYISDITMSARADHSGYTAANYLDVTSALRVAVSAGTDATALTAYTTFSKAGTAVDVFGPLDLNADGVADKEAGYEDFQSLSELVYGDASKTAASTAITQLTTSATATDIGVANDSDPHKIKGKPIAETDPTNGSADKQTVKVNLMIYLEGWQKLGDYKANVGGTANTDMQTIWNATKGVGAEFNLGIRFSAESHLATGE